MIKIMVVEDEGIIARDIQLTLQKYGYEVANPIASGEDAIELAQTFKPDLVLMDVHLATSMDGTVAAERIRQLMDVPIIFLTAYRDPETVARAQSSKPFGYLIKPFQEHTLRTTVETALRANRDRTAMSELNKELTEFASIVGHELKNPLAILDGFASLLHAGGIPDSGKPEAIKQIAEASNRLTNLVNGLLEFARIKSRGEPAELSALSDVATEAWKNLEHPGAELQVGILPSWEVDRNQFIHVFQNLFSNSIRYAKTGTPCKIDVSESNGQIVVEDNGIGVPEDERATLGKMFTRGSHGTGLGIGLSLTIAILARHNMHLDLGEGEMGGLKVTFGPI